MISYTPRQISIDIITDTPNPIIEWFNELWSRISTIETNVYNTYGGETIYYIVNDDGSRHWIFYRDIKGNNVFLSNYQEYFLDIVSNVKYRYNIHIITRILVENVLNDNIPLPFCPPEHFAKTIQNVLQNVLQSDILKNIT